MSKRLILMLCAALLCGVFVAACGDDEGGGGGGGGGGGEETGATEGAKVIDPSLDRQRQGRGDLLPGQGHVAATPTT